jgi:putative DNA-invertase from lambdoid prophage Rac
LKPAGGFDRLERGDVPVVCKLDRPGGDVIDVVSTVNKLAGGRMTMNVLAAVAQFKRDLLIERT